MTTMRYERKQVVIQFLIKLYNSNLPNTRLFYQKRKE